MILPQSKLGEFIAETFRQVAKSRSTQLQDGVIQDIEVEIAFQCQLVADDGVNAVTRKQTSTPSSQTTVSESAEVVSRSTREATESTVEQAPSTTESADNATQTQRSGGTDSTTETNTYEAV